MASTPLLILIFFVFSSLHPSLSLLLPVSKHAPSGNYLTRIRLGSSSVSLLVDLPSPSLWIVDCAGFSPIASLSIPCSSPDPCTVPSFNPISKLSAPGELVSDSELLFVCAPRFLADGLPGGAIGVFGLGRSSRIAPISQFAHQLDLPGKFSICLPNKGAGFILAGKSISRSLIYTPLLNTGSENDYNIQVKSIKIGGKRLSLSLPTIRAKLSTVDRLTRIGGANYATVLKAFSIAAGAVNMTRVDSIHPFALCYGASEAEIPAIDLSLQSEMVRWRIGGRNSMVEAGDGVVCLGVLDGGADLGEGEMVIGAHQLEEVLMEIDLRSGMLGFSTSLPEMGTSCGGVLNF